MKRDRERLLTLLLHAHRLAKRFCQTPNLDGYCLEASVVMVEYLLRRRVANVQLRRRLYDGDGHWTIILGQQEYDPTCADWTNPPARTKPGSLYKITKSSPHHQCPLTRVNQTAAYECVGIKRKSR
jgi:hypothetical protein